MTTCPARREEHWLECRWQSSKASTGYKIKLNICVQNTFLCIFDTWLVQGRTAKLKRTRETHSKLPTKFIFYDSVCNQEKQKWKLIQNNLSCHRVTCENTKVQKLPLFILSSIRWQPLDWQTATGHCSGTKREETKSKLSILLRLSIHSWIPRTCLFPIYKTLC